MKKKTMLLAAVFAAGVLTGTPAYAEETSAEPVVEAQAAETEENNAEQPAEQNAAEEAASSAEAGEAAAAAEAPAAVGNPMLEYPDIPSLERSVGFPVYYLPGNLLALYHPAAHIYSIDRYISDIRFQSKADDSTITVRTGLIERVGTDDISGYHGEWTQQSAGDVKRTPVYVARTESGMRVVRWSAGRFAFAVTMQGIDDETFKNMLKNFVSVADRFAHKYRNFRLNIKKPQPSSANATTEAPAPADAGANAAPAPQETGAAEAAAAAATP